MDELEKLLSKRQTITSINLEFCELETLEEILPVLQQFPKLEELLLFGNRIQQLPPSLSVLKNLKILDISNNMITSIKHALAGLKSLPSLTELHVTLSSDDEEQTIVQNLPNLLKLNGQEVERENMIELSASIDYNDEAAALKQEDLEQVAVIYDEIREMWRKQDPNYDKALAEDFDDNIKSVMEELSGTISQSQPSFIVHSIMLKAKFTLYSLCRDKLDTLVMLNNSKVGKLLQDTTTATIELFHEVLKIISIIYDKYNDKIFAMRNDFEKAMKETTQVLEAAEHLEKQSAVYNVEKQSLREEYEQQIADMQAEIDNLTEENKKYLEIIIKKSKQNAEAALSTSSIKVNNTSHSKSFTQLATRTLTLKQLKDVIDEIYASKEKFDKKCADGKMPRETMEQHMYTFLNQKYGLKNIIIEWAGAIIAGIRKYSSEDNDIAVFGKILRNECDEEFRFVQVQVKDTVLELLKMHLRGKFPLKSNQDLQEMINERLQGYISEEEWVDIVKYMYNETDSEILVKLLEDIAQQKAGALDMPQKGKMSRSELKLMTDRIQENKGRLPYSDFLKTLLDFQLKGHEKFLGKYIRLFRNIDNENNGVLDERGFRDLVRSMALNLEDSDVNRLLQIIDPYNNQQITFSETVALFSSEVIPSEEGTMSVLQTLSLSEKFQ